MAPVQVDRSLGSLPTWDDDGSASTVIETPKGSRNKLVYEPRLGAFKLSKVLPVGMSFPYDFGFVPGTVGGDGDPLDVLVLMDEPVYPGCVVPTRLVGVIEGEQHNDDGWVRNDRLIGVATSARNQAHVRNLRDLRDTLLDEIEAFFVDYHRIQGHEFRPIGRKGSATAHKLVDEAQRPGEGV
jgi:inorganic pyrophosphatase